uniref:Protein SUPPRESSOR OF GENE SILENCING 3 n=1 Tax=Solanum tuberosum TaxID=4113 RepID=M1DHD1_SOLTU
MSSNNNKIIGKLGNKSTQYKSILKTFEEDERNIDVSDVGLNFDKSDEWFVCDRKFDNKVEKTITGKIPWISQSPISESWEDKNSTCGHPIVSKLELRNNVGSSNQFDFHQDESDEDNFFSDDVFDEYTNIKEMNNKEQKKCFWFKKFFECLKKLTIHIIGDPMRQWHCPACKGGPGEIRWFTGLHSLISHTKTKGGSRFKLHKELAQLLEE